ncbi:MAG: transposase, partial [Methylocella sp.]
MRDFSWFARRDGACCRLATRFESNTPLLLPRDMPLAKGSDALAGAIGFLPARLASNRKNPRQSAVREIIGKTDRAKKLRILANDLDAPAKEIAALSKRRWQIELFFSATKQTLKIAKFLGRPGNAVRIQIAVAPIAFLLLRLLQEIAHAKHGFLELVRLVRADPMHRK